MKVHLVTNAFIVWISIVSLFVGRFAKNSNFFSFGPGPSLFIFGIPIDTYWKYSVVVAYTLVSTALRTIQGEIIMPWIIQSVQNKNPKSEYTRTYAYQVVIIDNLYRWFDWFMYMSILLQQIDMIMVEMIGNLIISYVTTRIYLTVKNDTLLDHNQT